MKTKSYIAVDLGASNGRSILGRFDGQQLEIEELNRFENNYVRVGDAYYWDVLRMYSNIVEGLKQYAKSGGGPLGGIGIDTWGVDFGLIDKQGRLAGNPRAYRDPRAPRGMKAFHDRYGKRAAFDITGIANMAFNTNYQLFDMVMMGDPQIAAADKLLLMPDLIAYMLCGRKTCEYTHATTTQMLDVSGRWSSKIADMIGIDMSLLPKIQKSGERKADLYEHIQRDAGLKEKVPVFCVGSHDTASAVASIPATTDNFAFLSSGTWSLIGIERDDVILGDTVYENNFSNEGTVSGGVRLLRNIMGMWIIQNCRRQWNKKRKMSWEELTELAKAAPAFASIIDVNAPMFYDGKGMIEKIQKCCEDSGQEVPTTIGEITRTFYESLAMCYREAFLGLEQIKGGRIDVLHVVGGGAQNKLLCQMTADAIGRPVVAGPVEATATGNLMMQIKASGEVADFAQMRQVIRASFDVETFEPSGTDVWEAQYGRYMAARASTADRK